MRGGRRTARHGRRFLLHDEPAFWVDGHGHATTIIVARVAPSQRLLDRIHVARGFTASQYYDTIRDLPTAVDQPIKASPDDTGGGSHQARGCDKDASLQTPLLIVAPAVDAQYRAGDASIETHAKTFQARTLARLATYAERYDIPVLVTRTERNEFTEPVATAADHHLEYEQTRMGPRIVGEGGTLSTKS